MILCVISSVRAWLRVQSRINASTKADGLLSFVKIRVVSIQVLLFHGYETLCHASIIFVSKRPGIFPQYENENAKRVFHVCNLKAIHIENTNFNMVYVKALLYSQLV